MPSAETLNPSSAIAAVKVHVSCGSCGSDKFSIYSYSNHNEARTLKISLKQMLPYVNRLIPEKSRLKKFSREIFHGKVHVCRNCGYGRLTRSLSEAQIMNYYQNTYWMERNPRLETASKDDFRAQSQVTFAMAAQPPNIHFSNMLEIGAGRALASQAMREQIPGLTVNVCEAGKQFEDYYRERSIQRIAHLFPFFASPMTFDYIHASHWLEHVLDLSATVAKLHSLLIKKGVIFIEVPNTSHQYWSLPISDAPHIHFFTPRSLSNFFERHGFKCLRQGEYGPTVEDLINGHILEKSDYYTEKPGGAFLRAAFMKAEK